MLADVKNSLVSKIYESKEEVINTFKIVIGIYQRYIIRVKREEKVKELLRIRDDFNNIISFINKTYINRDRAYNEVEKINEYIKTINSECLETLQELIDIDYSDDEYYDEKFEEKIVEFKEIIKEYKKEMTSYNTIDEEIIDIKENTDNLVFCLTSDIDLSSDSFQKEFIGTISELESKSSQELKRSSGRKGMSRIKKTTESNKEEDLAEYLEKRRKAKIHFVPYRYSSGSHCRTGLIKFEPSSIVKQFLENRYGLSKQSAYYGIFIIIQVIRADHSEYSYIEEYIFDNFNRIEEIANLFASENPDFTKLTMVVDKMLNIKKEKQDLIIKVNDGNMVKK